MSAPSAARWTGRLIARNKLVSGSIAVFAVAAIVVSVLTTSPAAALPPAPVAAGFSLTALGQPGQRVSLAQYQGKPVIVNFWASWCTDCQTETPLLASWHKQHGQVDLIGLDENDATAKALAFARAKGITYPLGSDPLTIAASAYGVNALPQTFFLNAKHQIVERVFGAVTTSDLSEGVSLMNAAAAPGEKVIQPS